MVVAFIGRSLLNFYSSMGFYLWLTIKLVLPPYPLKLLGKQLLNIGFTSLPIVALTGLFSGSVLALQSYIGFARFGADTGIPMIVVISTTRELAPVLTGLMVAGRVSSAITAEIGSMKISEQLDAMKMMSVNIQDYLLKPRFLAAIISLPLLTLVADLMGIIGGFLVGVYKLNFVESMYINSTFEYLYIEDVLSGLYKALSFGAIIAIVGYGLGLTTKKGAEGVGIATKNSVVFSTLLILCMNYVLTYVLF